MSVAVVNCVRPTWVSAQDMHSSGLRFSNADSAPHPSQTSPNDVDSSSAFNPTINYSNAPTPAPFRPFSEPPRSLCILDSPPVSPVYAPTSPQLPPTPSTLPPTPSTLTTGTSAPSEPQLFTPGNEEHSHQGLPVYALEPSHRPMRRAAAHARARLKRSLKRTSPRREWEVLTILDSRFRGRRNASKLQYHVMWMTRELTWEPARCLTSCNVRLAEYHQANRSAAGCEWAARRLMPDFEYDENLFTEWLLRNN